MKELEAIKARVEAATAGPWEVYDPNEGTGHSPLWCVANEAFHNPPADEEAEWLGVEIYVGDKEDAEFIAHSPADMAKLIAALEAVEKLAEGWRYKGEFGWGAWQEGHGPDPEGHVLDGAAGDIRQTITEALA